MHWIYILRCENDIYYVGQTRVYTEDFGNIKMARRNKYFYLCQKKL